MFESTFVNQTAYAMLYTSIGCMRSVDFVILATISRNQISQDDAFTGTEVTCAYAAHPLSLYVLKTVVATYSTLQKLSPFTT